MKSIFVTTGATVTFKELIELTLDKKFISIIQGLGYQKIVIQYGSQQDGVTLFTQGLKSLDSKFISHDLGANNGVIVAELPSGFKIEGFAFTTDIKTLMLNSDLIISHAGTGSILDSLRLQKPLIVVVNTKLMNNHQIEITDELIKGNYLLGCAAKLDELISNVKLINQVKLNALPQPNTNVIDQIIQQV